MPPTPMLYVRRRRWAAVKAMQAMLNLHRRSVFASGRWLAGVLSVPYRKELSRIQRHPHSKLASPCMHKAMGTHLQSKPFHPIWHAHAGKHSASPSVPGTPKELEPAEPGQPQVDAAMEELMEVGPSNGLLRVGFVVAAW